MRLAPDPSPRPMCPGPWPPSSRPLSTLRPLWPELTQLMSAAHLFRILPKVDASFPRSLCDVTAPLAMGDLCPVPFSPHPMPWASCMVSREAGRALQHTLCARGSPTGPQPGSTSSQHSKVAAQLPALQQRDPAARALSSVDPGSKDGGAAGAPESCSRACLPLSASF